MNIPNQNDSGWKLATVDHNGKLNFGGNRASKLRTGRKQVDFTYFETMLNIPVEAKNEFKLSFTKADDGARVYVFNSRYPEGFFRGQIKLWEPPVTKDYKECLVAGEQNRIVIVQFDDAAMGNNLMGGQVLINGKPLNKYFTPSNSSTDKKAKTVSITAKQQEKATTKDSFKDSRDGEVYKIVKIGNQVWMAENLRYNVKGSWLNPDNPSKEYGRLYTWEQARNACPKGWHVPTDVDWDKLINYSGGWKSAGIKLKSTNGWAENSNGNNTNGFNALPSGIYRKSKFTQLGEQTIFWASVKGKSYHGSPRSIAYWDNKNYLKLELN